MAFTDVGAWAFAAQLLESGHPLSRVELRSPAGRVAYEIAVAEATARKTIYIKLMPAGDRVVGRSFHYSTRGTRE
jgi:hypothetical protein